MKTFYFGGVKYKRVTIRADFLPYNREEETLLVFC